MPDSWDPWSTALDGESAAPAGAVLAPSLLGEGIQQDVGPTRLGQGSLDDVDFISVLGLAQLLQFDFVPITWYPEMNIAGVGATAQIRQALVDLEQTYVFKRTTQDSRKALRVLQSEISTLGHPKIRNHPNIISLEGICWDIHQDAGGESVIWPVLMLPKSSEGNLEHFVASLSGRNVLSSEVVLRLLSDVARGIACLHSSGIVHGDLKPDNILICRDSDGNLLAKVADMGYSTSSIGKRGVQVTMCEPWTDPSYRGEFVDFEAAKKLDAFSFGQICLWTVEQVAMSFTPTRTLPSGCLGQIVKRSATADVSQEVLALLKNIPGLTISQTQVLSSALRGYLDLSIESRSSDMNSFIRIGESSLTALTSSLTQLDLGEADELMDPLFSISKDLFRFLKSDFRLAGFIIKCLEEQLTRASSSPVRLNAAFQLAVCHAIGFGIRLNMDRAQSLLRESGKSFEELQAEIERISLENRWELKSQALRIMESESTLDLLDARQILNQAHIMKAAKEYYSNLIEDFEKVFYPDHSVVVLAKFLLAMVFDKTGRYSEAREIYLSLSKTMSTCPGWGPLHKSTLEMQADSAGMAFKLGQYALAEKEFRLVLDGCTQSLGEDHRETLRAQGSLAQTLSNLAKLSEAETLARRSVKGLTLKFGENHPETLGSMGNLATILSEQGRLVEAEDILYNAVTRRHKMVGRNNLETMILEGNLAGLYSLRGKLSEAESLANEVLDEIEASIGRSHPDAVYLLGNLASTFHSLGKNTIALELDTQILAGDSLDAKHPYRLTIKSNIAVIYLDQGHYDKALELLHEVVDLRTSVLGLSHPDTLTALNNMAGVYHRQCKFTESRELYERVLETRKNTLGPQHPGVLTTSANLAYLLQQIGLYQEAARLIETTLDLLKSVMGPLHDTTLVALSTQGSIRFAMGDVSGAITACRSAVDGLRATTGDQHHDTIQAMSNLAVYLESTGDYEKSEEYFKLAIQGELTLGHDHPLISSALDNYGMMLFTLGRMDEAERCISRALEDRKRTLGENNLDTLNSCYNTALLSHGRNRTIEAVEILRKVSKGREQLLGEGHPDMRRTLKNLGQMEYNAGKYEESSNSFRRVVELTARCVGGDSTELVDLRMRLAQSLRLCGKATEASAVLGLALDSCRLVYDAGDMRVLDMQLLQALLYYDRGEHKAAEDGLRAILRQWEDSEPSSGSKVFEAFHVLGLVLFEQGSLEEAKQLLARALEGREKLSGSRLQFYESLGTHALVLAEMGEVQVAKEQMERAWKGFDEVAGSEHPLTGRLLQNLAGLVMEQGDLPEAKRLFSALAMVREKALGPNNPQTLEVAEILGQLSALTGDNENAVVWLQMAYDGYKLTLPEDNETLRECEDDLKLAIEMATRTE